MLASALTIGFFVILASVATLAWAKADYRCRTQKEKLLSLHRELEMAQKALNRVESERSTASNDSKIMKDGMRRIGRLIGGVEHSDPNTVINSIYSVLANIAPDAVASTKKPKLNQRRSEDEAHDFFQKIKRDINPDSE